MPKSAARFLRCRNADTLFSFFFYRARIARRNRHEQRASRSCGRRIRRLAFFVALRLRVFIVAEAMPRVEVGGPSKLRDAPLAGVKIVVKNENLTRRIRNYKNLDGLIGKGEG